MERRCSEKNELKISYKDQLTLFFLIGNIKLLFNLNVQILSLLIYIILKVYFVLIGNY